MTKDDLYFYIQTKKPLEFKFNDKTYRLYYDTDSYGKDIIFFGQIFEGKPFDSFGDLMNKAKVENYFFKDLLEDIN